jgi:hypothetical protein
MKKFVVFVLLAILILGLALISFDGVDARRIPPTPGGNYCMRILCTPTPLTPLPTPSRYPTDWPH